MEDITTRTKKIEWNFPTPSRVVFLSTEMNSQHDPGKPDRSTIFSLWPSNKYLTPVSDGEDGNARIIDDLDREEPCALRSDRSTMVRPGPALHSDRLKNA